MSYCAQGRLFTFEDFFVEGDDNHRLVMVLDALDDDGLIRKLELGRGGRLDHYPVRMLWQSLIAAKVYGILTINGLIRELRRNGSLRRLVDIGGIELVPKPWHFSRFMSKLAGAENVKLVREVFERAVDSLREIVPDLAESIVFDARFCGSTATACTPKQPFLSRSSSPQGNTAGHLPQKSPRPAAYRNCLF